MSDKTCPECGAVLEGREQSPHRGHTVDCPRASPFAHFGRVLLKSLSNLTRESCRMRDQQYQILAHEVNLAMSVGFELREKLSLYAAADGETIGCPVLYSSYDGRTLIPVNVEVRVPAIKLNEKPKVLVRWLFQSMFFTEDAKRLLEVVKRRMTERRRLDERTYDLQDYLNRMHGGGGVVL